MKQDEGARAIYLIDSERTPEPGERFANPDYAATLRLIAEEGPDVLYGGELGARVAERVQELGGFVTLEDLACHESRWVEPLSASFRGHRVWQIPPPGQGSVFSSFGSGVAVPGTGFHLQNRGSGFTMEPGLPNTVGPEKEPFHTIIPGFVTRVGEDGVEEPWMSFGVMGGAVQPQGHVQLLLNLLLFDMDLQDAIDAPRFRHTSGMSVGLEAPIGHETREPLRARGHDIGLLGRFGAGGAQAVLRMKRGWAAGSDPRKDGQAAGH